MRSGTGRHGSLGRRMRADTSGLPPPPPPTPIPPVSPLHASTQGWFGKHRRRFICVSIVKRIAKRIQSKRMLQYCEIRVRISS